MTIAESLSNSQSIINKFLSTQIDDLEKLIEFKRNLRSWYVGKTNWLSTYTLQLEQAFKKVNLQVSSFTINVRDNSNNVIDKSFEMPDNLYVQFELEMIGSRKPIIGGSKQLEVSARKLETSLKAAIPAEMGVYSISVNQYSLEARGDAPRKVLIQISFN